MKIYIFLAISFCLTMNSYSQRVKYISKYFSHYDGESEMNYFKIGSHELSFDEKGVFLDKKMVIEKDTATFFFLEVYSDKVLLVSFYPISQAHISTGPGFRPIQTVEFILLSDPTKRWLFDLKGMFNSESIKSFNEVTGELELNGRIRGKRV